MTDLAPPITAKFRSGSPLPAGPAVQAVPSISRENGLNQGQRARFETDGYLVVPNVLDERTIKPLVAEIETMLEEFSLENHPMARFTTDRKEGAGKENKHANNEYFMDSAHRISFFFEEDAFDASGNLIKPKSRAINKIGHSLHTLSPPFASLLAPSSTHSPGAIARSLGIRDPRCMQSMVICKHPEIGGAVPPHQDSTFLYTDPPSAVGFWYALEDTTRENGALSFVKGSHRWKGVEKRLVRGEGKSQLFVKNEGRKFARSMHEGIGDGEYEDINQEDHTESGDQQHNEDDEAYTMEEVKAGSLVLIHGNILHKSAKNTSSKSRLIYTYHVIEADGALYDERNWLQPPKEGFTKI